MDSRRNSAVGFVLCLMVIGAGCGTAWGAVLETSKLLASDGAASDQFGRSVSLDGSYAVIGASWDDQGRGSAYVFKRGSGTLNQEAKLIASDRAEYDEFGDSVGISGDIVIVGAPGDGPMTTDRGAAYIFQRSGGTTWNQVVKLTGSDTSSGDWFGWSVAISGSWAVVGAPNDDNWTGSAYIFEWNGSAWVQRAKLIASDAQPWTRFGWSVSISGDDRVIVGAFASSSPAYESGAAYIFKRSGSVWSEEAKLVASDGAASDQFGRAVDISGDYAIVGAPHDDDKGDSSGSAYVFNYGGGVWSEQAKLTASNGGGWRLFGWSVSMDGSTVVIGSYWDPGSAYRFDRDGTVWIEVVEMKGSDCGADDEFACSVDFANDWALVGAEWQDDNGISSGAAYLYTIFVEPVEIRGSKWHDANGDGVRDADESGLAGWTVFIDLNNNGVLDVGEPKGITDAEGLYLIIAHVSGNIIVSEEPQEDWEQTFPAAGGSYSFNVEAGDSLANVNFGNVEVGSTEYRRADLNGDGIVNVVDIVIMAKSWLWRASWYVE